MKPVDNPPNPYESAHTQWLEPPPEARLTVYQEQARSALAENDSPDLPFRWSCNPYRGCQHGCAYCYARTTHQYLGFGAGTDFDTRIVVKVNLPEALEKTLARPSWRGEAIFFSGATDCYQPLEASYHLTRRCLEVCLRHRNPVAVLTKSFLIARDVDLLARLHRTAGLRVQVSIPLLDPTACKALEPQAATPARRFQAIRHLADAGVPVGVMIAPIVPGLSDREVPAILQRAREAGASWATCTALHLPGTVQQVFLARLRADLPLKARRVEQRLHDIRGGNLGENRPGLRMKGQGPYWDSIMKLFELWRDRLGFEQRGDRDRLDRRPPGRGNPSRGQGVLALKQLTLFE
ncbi:MAG: PA0069 family radical SAM protein [Phycisphaerae bacterium]